jgi:hypothetical protein
VVLHALVVVACSISEPLTSAHVVDPAESADIVAPTITNVTAGSSRHEPEGCIANGAKCEGLASVHVKVAATDDRTAAAKLGYLFTVLPDGDYPDGFKGWGSTAIVVPNGEVWDFISYDDEDFDFDIEVRAVDLNGNVSEPRVVNIESNSLLGCSTTRSDWAVLPVLVFILRRRRLLDSTLCRKRRST